MAGSRAGCVCERVRVRVRVRVCVCVCVCVCVASQVVSFTSAESCVQHHTPARVTARSRLCRETLVLVRCAAASQEVFTHPMPSLTAGPRLQAAERSDSQTLLGLGKLAFSGATGAHLLLFAAHRPLRVCPAHGRLT